jgi:hypothetical protein
MLRVVVAVFAALALLCLAFAPQQETGGQFFLPTVPVQQQVVRMPVNEMRMPVQVEPIVVSTVQNNMFDLLGWGLLGFAGSVAVLSVSSKAHRTTNARPTARAPVVTMHHIEGEDHDLLPRSSVVVMHHIEGEDHDLLPRSSDVVMHHIEGEDHDLLPRSSEVTMHHIEGEDHPVLEGPGHKEGSARKEESRRKVARAPEVTMHHIVGEDHDLLPRSPDVVMHYIEGEDHDLLPRSPDVVMNENHVDGKENPVLPADVAAAIAAQKDGCCGCGGCEKKAAAAAAKDKRAS